MLLCYLKRRIDKVSFVDKVTEKDDFLITASGDRVTYWSFRGEEAPSKPPKSAKQESLHHHTSPISCLDISRDGAMAVTGGVDSLVNLWQLNTHELLSTFEGHIASVTCIAFSASGLFVASGNYSDYFYNPSYFQ